jgi:CBS domain-containing protein
MVQMAQMSAVSEIMSPKKIVSIAIESGPSALDAAKLMIKSKVGAVVVTKAGKPVGIVTERDVLKKVAASSKPAKDIAVKSIMSSPLITIKAIDSIETAAAVMSKNRIKRLVVLEQDGSLAGVLSITDIARKLAKILANDYSRYGRLKAILDL